MRSYAEMAADHQHNLHGAIALFLDDDTAQDLKPIHDAREFFMRGLEPYNQALIEGMRAKGLKVHSLNDMICFLPMFSRRVLQTYMGKLQDLLPKWKAIVDQIGSVEGEPTAKDIKKVVDLGVTDLFDDVFAVVLTNMTVIFDTFEVPEDKRIPRAVVQSLLLTFLPLSVEFCFKLALRNADLIELYAKLIEKYVGTDDGLEELPVEDAA